MPTKDSLREKYAQMDTTDLLEVANDKTAYTELANSVAFEELRRRNVPAEEIKAYKPVQRVISQEIKDNCLIDLSILQKLLYFFILWFPKVWDFYQPEFKQSGYLLKNNQSNYYSVLGFGACLLSLIISMQSVTPQVFFILWGGAFLLAYVFDALYNRDRQRDNIKKAVASGDIPWGF